MRLYNSLTNDIEEFRPTKEGEITIYSCGPTVYDKPHIGNLSTYIYADTLKRALKRAYPSASIKHVINITDIDDKTIKKSQELYPDLEPLAALRKVTREYEAIFINDLKNLNIDTDSIDFVRATDYIPKMQDLITTLVENKVAYITDDGIYFSISAYQAKGKIYGQLVKITAESTGAARVNNDEYDKDNIHDFALWKLEKPDEPSWDFEIGGHNLKGRPGWHIECSAMSTDKLGIPFDIHTGGVDLKFPHHENEIAQSTATIEGSRLANLFFHSEHMLVDEAKMAKSLGNFYTLEDIISKGYDALAFRLFVLQSHYKSQSHFSWDNLKSAQNRLDNIRQELSQQTLSANSDLSNDITYHPDFTAVDNDLNTPMLLEQFKPNDVGLGGIDEVAANIDQLLGLDLSSSLKSKLTDHQLALITERETARSNSNWAESDRLRDELKAEAIGLKDTDSGAIWFRLKAH